MSVSSENNKTIPHEIIFEILLRLPVKSLCRFKCVSSSWLALISDPQFVMLQLHRNKRRNLILSNLSGNSAYNYSIDEEKLVSVELDFPLEQDANRDGSGYLARIVGSCNGLVCTTPKPKIFFVLNPLTRESKRIPDVPFEPFPRSSDDLYGFGCTAEDCKFIKVSFGLKPNMSVAIFSLRMNSWRRVLASGYTRPLINVPGTLTNGALHWRLQKHGGDFVLAAFDLVERGKMKEHWIMKEYGVKESWTRVFIHQDPNNVWPLCLWKNSTKLLVINRKNLLVCDCNNEGSEDVAVADVPNWNSACVYVESLVSPN
ncbi:F-box/kelch-repeat protein At3g06240 [Citrus clementina]|uniref:F-box/kelch-repeat protein At3g06240 n=1 Tax=Citrus clementina TaxID=85681 RepID=UPI000CECFB3D|nr:F-box/kelch-repeat protein At3g06240 [Citrus x clementina]